MGNPVEDLATVPGDDKPWYKQAHLLKLNFITLSMVLFCMSPKSDEPKALQTLNFLLGK